MKSFNQIKQEVNLFESTKEQLKVGDLIKSKKIGGFEGSRRIEDIINNGSSTMYKIKVGPKTVTVDSKDVVKYVRQKTDSKSGLNLKVGDLIKNNKLSGAFQGSKRIEKVFSVGGEQAYEIKVGPKTITVMAKDVVKYER